MKISKYLLNFLSTLLVIVIGRWLYMQGYTLHTAIFCLCSITIILLINFYVDKYKDKQKDFILKNTKTKIQAEEKKEKSLKNLSKHQKEIMQKQANKLLPVLSVEQMIILTKLQKKLIELNRYSKETIVLEKNNLIKLTTKISNRLGLYEIHPITKSIIDNFIDKKKQQTLIDHIINSSQDERTFFKLFVTPSPTKPNEPEHPWLTHNIYQACDKLVNKGILINKPYKNDSSKKIIQIIDNAIPFVEKYILGCKVQRVIIILDLKNIQGVCQSGSGSHGSP